MAVTNLQIPKEYNLVLLTGLAINLHAAMQADPVARERARIFPVEFMEKFFGNEHKKELG